MKLLLLNNEGHPVACFDHLEQYDVQSPSQVFALLDLVETLIKTAKQDREEAGSTRG